MRLRLFRNLTRLGAHPVIDYKMPANGKMYFSARLNGIVMSKEAFDSWVERPDLFKNQMVEDKNCGEVLR